ncbi:MAG: KUP/HAK/KT family potassium transporter [Cyclobacteriaceae bacterium]
MVLEASKHTPPLSAGGVLVSFGIIYGDIGTSPLYVFTAIVGDRVISKDLVFGGLSCVFWTLILITTIKYIYLALNADNKGEGGIFALYALVRRYKAGWVVYPAIIGCATLIADGFLTPAISISSAVEGLRFISPEIPTITIVICIMIALFVFQQFGTGVVGSTFGPVMALWFLTIGGVGIYQLIQNPSVLAALNPFYAANLLIKYPGGFWILGAVFLATTGAEALYSDLGHVGKENVRAGWSMVIVCLLLNYFGQGAWLMGLEGQLLGGQRPFFATMPSWMLLYGIGIATFAAIIASQALISGTFTLVNEAMKLKLWPMTRVRYPSELRGQIYIPSINWILLTGCILVVLIFRESEAMEGAYGLAITINMLMTTLLLVFYFSTAKHSTFRTILIGIVFFSLEIMFLISNLDKFPHGGWFTFAIALLFFVILFVQVRARKLRTRHTEFVDLKHYVQMIQDLQSDSTIPKEATNLVYLAVADRKQFIDANIIFSVFKKRPKRADVYWFLHVDTVDSPFTSKYAVDTVIPRKCFFVSIRLGFKADHRINLIFNKIIHEMADAGEVDLTSPYPSLRKYSMQADFKFIILQSWASSDSVISNFERMIIQGYRLLKRFSLSTEEHYGIEGSNLEIEKAPIQVGPTAKIKIKREREG